MFDVHTLLGAFLDKSLRSAGFNDEAFPGKETKLPVRGLLPSSARLLGFPD